MTADSTVRFAVRDSVWRYEDIGRASYPYGMQSPPTLCVNAQGAIAAAYDSLGTVYALRTDSGWSSTWLASDGIYPRLSFSGRDVPHITAVLWRGWGGLCVFAQHDTGWVVEELHFGVTGFVTRTSAPPVQFASDSTAHLFVYNYWEMRVWLWDSKLYLFENRGSGWNATWDSTVERYGHDALALELDSGGRPVYLHSDDREVLLEDEYVAEATGGVLRLDSLDRPHVVLPDVDSVAGLRYAYRTAVWHFHDVPGAEYVLSSDLLLDDGQPVVTFVEREGGLWLARGVGIVGIGEQQDPAAHGSVPKRTVYRAPDLARLDCRVLDIQGRDVTVQKRSLSPGVYFLKPSADSRQPVRKVILQR